MKGIDHDAQMESKEEVPSITGHLLNFRRSRKLSAQMRKWYATLVH
jgi:hypothetical protein